MGAGGAVAVAAAIFAGVSVQNDNKSSQAEGQALQRNSSDEICLLVDAPMIEGAAKGCYSPSGTAEMADAAVLDDDAEPVRLSLAHPTDDARALAVAENCRRYRELTSEGWYALSGREMRREAYFERACGMLSLIERARSADVTYFKNNGMSEEDARSLAQNGGFAIGPRSEGNSSTPVVEQAGEHRWSIDTGGSVAVLQELAHADFNGDSRGDILTFVTIRAKEGTAHASRLGVLDKAGANGPVRFIDRADIR